MKFFIANWLFSFYELPTSHQQQQQQLHGTSTHCHDKSIALCSTTTTTTTRLGSDKRSPCLYTFARLLACPPACLTHSSLSGLTLTYVNVDKKAARQDYNLKCNAARERGSAQIPFALTCPVQIHRFHFFFMVAAINFKCCCTVFGVFVTITEAATGKATSTACCRQLFQNVDNHR